MQKLLNGNEIPTNVYKAIREAIRPVVEANQDEEPTDLDDILTAILTDAVETAKLEIMLQMRLVDIHELTAHGLDASIFTD